ncbi:HNH endonuclease signature motif containing protein [Variovorax sp. HW608]|uniref:HNH endonuclease n=1 Tax=Variovorax sp. HW608 TaxID=1034889 RepID=UPI000B5ADA34
MPGDPFYQSAAWKALRLKALRRDRWRCVLCGASVAARGMSRVDHIQSRKARPDLAMVLSNLRTLCPACDNRRHASDKARAADAQLRGADANGWPTSPAHSWNRTRFARRARATGAGATSSGGNCASSGATARPELASSCAPRRVGRVLRAARAWGLPGHSAAQRGKFLSAFCRSA